MCPLLDLEVMHIHVFACTFCEHVHLECNKYWSTFTINIESSLFHSMDILICLQVNIYWYPLLAAFQRKWLFQDYIIFDDKSNWKSLFSTFKQFALRYHLNTKRYLTYSLAQKGKFDTPLQYLQIHEQGTQTFKRMLTLTYMYHDNHVRVYLHVIGQKMSVDKCKTILNRFKTFLNYKL